MKPMKFSEVAVGMRLIGLEANARPVIVRSVRSDGTPFGRSFVYDFQDGEACYIGQGVTESAHGHVAYASADGTVWFRPMEDV